MRTRRLFVLTLVVLLLHVVGWRAAAGNSSPFELGARGPRGPASVSVQASARVPLTMVETGAALATPPPPGPVPGRLPEPGPLPARERMAAKGPAPTQGLARARASRATGRTRPPDAAAWPVYATRAPPSATLHYAIAQRTSAAASAPSGGEATLEWTNTGAAFALRLATAVDGRPPREWESTGGFDAAGVAPLRLVERERGRDRRSLDFDRQAGRVRFSGAPGTPRTVAGAQDRWSWMAQLAAIAEAGSRRGRLEGPWHVQVAGLRGDLERWTFRVLPPSPAPPELAVQGNELSAAGHRAPALLHVLRAPERPYDLRIEAWLSPSLHHFPAGLRMSTPPGPWSFSLWQHST